jgi:hypothetical protein
VQSCTLGPFCWFSLAMMTAKRCDFGMAPAPLKGEV